MRVPRRLVPGTLLVTLPPNCRTLPEKSLLSPCLLSVSGVSASNLAMALGGTTRRAAEDRRGAGPVRAGDASRSGRLLMLLRRLRELMAVASCAWLRQYALFSRSISDHMSTPQNLPNGPKQGRQTKSMKPRCDRDRSASLRSHKGDTGRPCAGTTTPVHSSGEDEGPS